MAMLFFGPQPQWFFFTLLFIFAFFWTAAAPGPVSRPILELVPS